MKTKILIITVLFSSKLLCMSATEKIQRKQLSDPAARSSLLDRAQASGRTIETRPQVGAQEPANKIIYKMQEGVSPHVPSGENPVQVFREDALEQNRSDLAEVNVNSSKESADAAKKINEKYEQGK